MKNLDELLFDIQEKLKKITFYDELKIKQNRDENWIELKKDTNI
ncbi:MAG TPA: hypothetical protein PLE45_11690 [Spirochaetota bacterium]|nr:hypothetical protein [Spirochaetota bacterium]HOL57870.1 hypothetical protein [Spirochaetota bacterium]HPP05445.1 hypothetical protein [Spirochaetota bacterium]